MMYTTVTYDGEDVGFVFVNIQECSGLEKDLSVLVPWYGIRLPVKVHDGVIMRCWMDGPDVAQILHRIAVGTVCSQRERQQRVEMIGAVGDTRDRDDRTLSCNDRDHDDVDNGIVGGVAVHVDDDVKEVRLRKEAIAEVTDGCLEEWACGSVAECVVDEALTWNWM